ncbi:hypothetical protein T265_13153 [Opisthorchis viverrini]|uniref:TGF-beta family profile domain-containing protein n=1 Tax=Opisthorchis viverrini TaxID=6198 RepID=A0A074ZX92_OPIVI|nr:hypothetical protein T265_13153 [Opisthorchis viverrini]KER30547.1 hypothetical protein T265_13153 [Opisthorchis viverrini]
MIARNLKMKMQFAGWYRDSQTHIMCLLILACCASRLSEPSALENALLEPRGPGSLVKERPDLLHGTMMFHVLSALTGQPKQLSIDELEDLRRTIPRAVENYVNVMNNAKLLEDLSTGKLEKKLFEDYQKSLVFLETGKCSLTRDQQPYPCLIIRKPIEFPESPIILARLSAFVLPWIRPDNLALSVHFLDETQHHFEEDIFRLDNVTKIFDSFNVNWFSEREVKWDVTAAMVDIQRRQSSQSYPIILTLHCVNEKCRTDTTIWHLFSHPEFKEAILSPDGQAVLELYTDSTVDLVKKYGRRRLIGRSTSGDYHRRNGNNCPSFLDRDRQEAKCCLFRYTLTKRQLDQNDKLRFIVFPHHLPLNICHGRCIGLYMPTDNSHSVLLNRYFSGLDHEERNAIYDSMPCCAANETSPFTIVYKNAENKLVHETLERAIKMNCACN